MSETEAPYSEAFYSADTSANPEADNLEGSTEPTTSDSTDNSTSETPEVPQVVASVVHVEASKVIVNEVTGASPASSKSEKAALIFTQRICYPSTRRYSRRNSPQGSSECM